MNTNYNRIVDFSLGTGSIGQPTEDLSQLDGIGSQTSSAAEKAREKKLRDDPMAVVLGPLHVDCRRCGVRIKLSTKSPYDPLHWRVHRTRCLKRFKATERKDGPSHPKHDAGSSRGTPSVVKPTLEPLLLDGQDSSPLTSEDEHESQSGSTSARSSMQPTAAPPSARHSDPICEEYIRRYHGKETEQASASVEHWKEWSWTRLSLPPAFAATTQIQEDSL